MQQLGSFNKLEKTNKMASCILVMALGAACAGGACCHQFRVTLKWDHWPQTHLDTHARQDPTRILRPEGFSCCVFPLPVSQLTVLLNIDIQNWNGCFRWGNAVVKLRFQLLFLTSGSTGRAALKTHQRHILFSLHANLLKMFSHRLHTLFLLGRRVRENWKRTRRE